MMTKTAFRSAFWSLAFASFLFVLTTQAMAEAPAMTALELASAQAELEDFEKAYDYDVGYLSQLLHDSPQAYQVFSQMQAASQFRKALPLDAHYVARITTMQMVDCGPCTQLNLRMAVEAGVDRELLKTLLHKPQELPADLRDVHDHARDVVLSKPNDPERAARIRKQYGDEGFAELAVVITGCQIYPTLKRALLENERCEILKLDF